MKIVFYSQCCIGNVSVKCCVNQCYVYESQGIECGDVISGDGDAGGPSGLGPHLRVAIVSREVGGRAVFSCSPGFGLRGPHETVCLSSGEWAQPFPTCSGK